MLEKLDSGRVLIPKEWRASLHLTSHVELFLDEPSHQILVRCPGRSSVSPDFGTLRVIVELRASLFLSFVKMIYDCHCEVISMVGQQNLMLPTCSYDITISIPRNKYGTLYKALSDHPSIISHRVEVIDE